MHSPCSINKMKVCVFLMKGQLYGKLSRSLLESMAQASVIVFSSLYHKLAVIFLGVMSVLSNVASFV